MSEHAHVQHVRSGCSVNVVRLQLVSDCELRDCTRMARGHHHSSLSGALYGCARLPIHICGGSVDGSQPLLLFPNLSHAFGLLHLHIHPHYRLISQSETSCSQTTLTLQHTNEVRASRLVEA